MIATPSSTSPPSSAPPPTNPHSTPSQHTHNRRTQRYPLKRRPSCPAPWCRPCLCAPPPAPLRGSQRHRPPKGWTLLSSIHHTRSRLVPALPGADCRAPSVLIELVAPNKQTKLLPGEAVVRFDEEYLVHWSGMCFTRGLYGKRVDLALAELFMERVRALK